MTIKKSKLLNKDSNSMIYNNTSFPLTRPPTRKTRLLFCVHLIFILMQAELRSSYSHKGQQTQNDPVTATLTEHAWLRQWPREPNGVLLTPEREFSSPGAPVEREADCLLESEVPRWVTEPVRPPTRGLQERLRSSGVPTSILLYSFCCSSLKVSFTFPRFNPPSLQTGKCGKLVTTTATATEVADNYAVHMFLAD